MPETPNIKGEVLKKLPTLTEYRKSPNTAIQYVFMVAFLVYLAWNEWIRKDECSDRIETIQTTLKIEREMHTRTYNQMMSRIDKLENAIDVKNGVIREIGTKVGVDTPTETGGIK